MKKKKRKKIRDYHALNAILNRPAGPLKNKKDKRKKSKQEQEINDENNDS